MYYIGVDLGGTNIKAAIVDGEMDQYPEAAFYNVGTLDDVVAKAKKLEDGENG